MDEYIASSGLSPIKSQEAYRELLLKNKARFPKIITNCFVMEKFFHPYIDGGRAFYRWFDNGLVIYTSEGEYYNAHYYWDKESPFDDLSADKRVFLSEINNKGARDEYISDLWERLRRVGFMRYKATEIFNFDFDFGVGAAGVPVGFSGADTPTVSNACAACGDIAAINELEIEEKINELKKEGLSYCDNIDEEIFSKIVKLWGERLEETELPFADKSFALNDLNIICLVDEAREIAAAYGYRLIGSSAEGCHVVTSLNNQGKGLGKLLVKKSMIEASKKGAKKEYVYIRDGNEESLAMYGKIGFKPTGKTTQHFICHEKV